jgi:acyl phosphate:glycerol-3-phosphate acyltransferase
MIWGLLAGYLIGSLPTADLVARRSGVDLRASGSGNPGAANALRVGGRTLAVTVLVLDLLKGAAASLAGLAIDGEGAAIAAAVAAVMAQVHNPWFGFRGGKGLGVSAGTALVLWAPGLLVTLPVLALASKALRSAAGSLVGLVWFLVAAVTWAANGWSTLWGVKPDDRLVWYAIGILVITAPKFATDLGRQHSARR